MVHGDAALPHTGCRSIAGDDSRHTTPLVTFLRLPDSKLHGTHRRSGASCRRLAQRGYQRGRGRTDSGQGFSCFPRAAGVLPADPAAHKADHTPQPWGMGVGGGDRQHLPHPHTAPKGPRLWGPWKRKLYSKTPRASLLGLPYPSCLTPRAAGAAGKCSPGAHGQTQLLYVSPPSGRGAEMLSAAHAARPETGQECPMTQGTRGPSQRQRLPPRLSQPRSLQPRHQPPGVQTVKEENKGSARGTERIPPAPRRARRSHLASGCRRSRGSRPGPGGMGSSPSTGSGSACPRRAPGSPAARGTR